MSTDFPPKAASEERFARHQRITAVLMALIAVLAAVIAYLQSDSSNRDNQADRDSKRYALEAMGVEISGKARINYDYNTAYANWVDLSLLARSAAQRGDATAAQRYTTLRDHITTLSPMLAAPYFHPTANDAGYYRYAPDEVDVYRYIADTYLTQVTALQEKYLAASMVKESWGAKTGSYIAQLTLLAVALFLFGMSVMVPIEHTRWILSGAGLLIASVAAGWTITTFAQPVDDLRTRGDAIETYAQGVGLAYQDRWEEAIFYYDAALQTAPDYANALVGRAMAQSALGDHAAAAADLAAARAAGDTSAMTAGRLAWRYYLLGRFEDAAAMNQVALESNPEELWIQYDLGLSLLAAGQIDAARAAYAEGMTLAANQVAAAKAAGAEPPTYLWWELDDAVQSLEGLDAILDGGDGPPAREQIAHPERLQSPVSELVGQLKSLSIALELTGQPPTGALSAQISPFVFAIPVYSDTEKVVDYTPIKSVPFGVQEVAVLFDYASMQDGQRVGFKVYLDGQEEPIWRQFITWDAGASGAWQYLLTLSFSDNFELPAGDYTVDLYIDSHLAQQGSFTIEAPAEESIDALAQ